MEGEATSEEKGQRDSKIKRRLEGGKKRKKRRNKEGHC